MSSQPHGQPSPASGVSRSLGGGAGLFQNLTSTSGGTRTHQPSSPHATCTAAGHETQTRGGGWGGSANRQGSTEHPAMVPHLT